MNRGRGEASAKPTVKLRHIWTGPAHPMEISTEGAFGTIQCSDHGLRGPNGRPLGLLKFFFAGPTHQKPPSSAAQANGSSG